MNRFVRLKLWDDVREEFIERWFNVSAIRHIEPEANKVMLNGSRTAVTVTTDSMDALMEELANDRALKKVMFNIDKSLHDMVYRNMRNVVIKPKEEIVVSCSFWSKIKDFFRRRLS